MGCQSTASLMDNSENFEGLQIFSSSKYARTDVMHMRSYSIKTMYNKLSCECQKLNWGNWFKGIMEHQNGYLFYS